MKGVQAISTLFALSSAVLASTKEIEKRSVTPVTVQGNAFFAGSDRFFIRGIDYQPGGSSANIDPIANPSICKRDIPYFKQLGINTIRIYSVDNAQNHDECMTALADAGIYLALDVNNPKYSLNRADPAVSYNDVYLQSVFATIDEFAPYDNTLLFFSGNEVINSNKTTAAAPYVKAVTRDMKNYIQARGYRQVPVGYSAADVSYNRYEIASYMNCGSDGTARSDFFSFNDYSWCGADSSFEISGWSTNVETYSNYSIPLFLSEFGCNDPMPRHFDEISALYNKEMTCVYSGGLAYEYTEEAENPHFGLVKVSGSKVTELKDFHTLQQKYNEYPMPTSAGCYKKNLKPLPCPAYDPVTWRVKSDGLPAMPSPALKYFKNGAGAGPGLKGKGSQNAGTGSSGMVTTTDKGISPSSTAGSSTGGNAGATVKPADWPIAAMISAFTVLVSTFAGAAIL